MQKMPTLLPPKAIGTYQFLVTRNLQDYDNRLNLQIRDLGSELIAKTAEKIVLRPFYQKESNFLKNEINRLGRIVSGIRRARLDYKELVEKSKKGQQVNEQADGDQQSPIIKPMKVRGNLPKPIRRSLRKPNEGQQLERSETMSDSVTKFRSLSETLS